MVVLHVGLEMPGEVVDAFRQDRDLNLGRAGVAGLGGIRLDDFRFAFGGNRHRQTLPLLRAELAVSPVRLNTRLGMSSPLPISARARSASARLPSPDAALSHKASNCSSGIMSDSPNGPTSVRRNAQIWP